MWLVSLLTPATLMRWLGGIAAGVGFWIAMVAGWETGTIVLFWAGLVALCASFGFDAYLERKARLEAMAFAERSGWTYHRLLTGLLAPLTTPPFGSADATYTHVVAGTYGGLQCFDGLYTWRIKVDDAEVTATHRVAVVRLVDELPRIKILPEGLAGKFAKALGGRDTDFESSAFNRTWRVLADDDKVAHDMLSPRVLEYLNSLRSAAPMVFERGLGVRIDDAREGIGTLGERLTGLISVARFLPMHTVEEHGRYANSVGPLPSVSAPGGLTRGYDPERLRLDEEHLRTAKPRKVAWRLARSSMINAATVGSDTAVGTPPVQP